MSARKHLLWILAAMHLSMVVTSAFHIRYKKHGVGPVTAFYGAVSGASNTYSFFAPGVPNQTRMRFAVELADGSAVTVPLTEGETAEADRRINNTMSTALALTHDAQIQRVLLQSWAAKVFARLPGARRVVVRVEIYDMPTMAGYANGMRPDWRLLFSQGFERGHDLVSFHP